MGRQYKSKGMDFNAKKSRSRNDIQWDNPKADPMEDKLRAMVKGRNAKKNNQDFDLSSSSIAYEDPFIAPLLHNLPTDLDASVTGREVIAEGMIRNPVPAARRTHLAHIF